MEEIKNRIKISNNAPSYSKKLSKDSLYYLLLLQEEYKMRFAYGVSGNNVNVQILIPDPIMDEILEYLPFNIKSTSRIQKKREFDYVDILNKNTCNFDKKGTKEFFNIFDKELISPKIDRAWMFPENQSHCFKELNEKEMGQFYDEKIDTFKKSQVLCQLKEDFVSQNTMCSFRRISLIFGKTKLVHYQNAYSTSATGILRFHFSYQTYDNGKPTNFIKTKPTKKRKITENKSEEDEENESEKDEENEIYPTEENEIRPTNTHIDQFQSEKTQTQISETPIKENPFKNFTLEELEKTLRELLK